MPTMTKTAKQVISLMKKAEMTDIPSFIQIRRTHASHHQRSAGAWSWYAADERGRELIGSCWPVLKLLEMSKAGHSLFLYTNHGGLTSLEATQSSLEVA